MRERRGKVKKGTSQTAGRAGCFLFALLVACFAMIGWGLQIRQDVQCMGREIAKEIFRLHVVANSDSAFDQQIKLKVKEGILSYIAEKMGESESAKETKNWARAHLPELREVAKRIVCQQGGSYQVSAAVGEEYFPQKTYGDVTFPGGAYQALKIVLGNGKGKNWWCVLYPKLCFLDITCGEVPQEGKEKLKKVLAREDYELLVHPEEYDITTFFFRRWFP